MLIIDHISKLPSDAVLAVVQQDGSINVYMPGDDLPELPSEAE